MEETNPQQNRNSGPTKTIHTYSSDMADAVRDNEMSVIKIAMAEQRKHEREDLYRKAEGTGLTKSLFVIGGIILFLGSCFAVYFVINKNKETNAPISNITNTQIETIISYDNHSFVDATQVSNTSDLINLLKPEIEKAGKPDSISSIFLTTSESGTPELLKAENFISLMGLTAPAPLIRSLSGQYMVGTYIPATTSGKSKPHLFLIFQVKDYNIVYAGMLEWEKTILNDLYKFFDIKLDSGNSDLLETPFSDLLINNKDARILSNKSGEIILYYIFADKNNLIITDDQDTVNKIITYFILNKKSI